MQLRNCSLLLMLLTTGGLCSARHFRPKCKVECQRVGKSVDFGYDAARNKLSVDVGDCVRVPDKSDACRNAANETNLHPCAVKQCTVRAHELWTYTNRDGPFTVPVIKSCYPTRHHCQANCVRKPKLFYFFPQSKYQTRVDVGKCVGNCSVNNSCSAVSTRNISVNGPNGAVTIEAIQKCGCVDPACYRADYYESYWDYVKYGNITVRSSKLINVGKCIGSCEGILYDLCFLSPFICDWPKEQTKCAPTVAQDNHYMDHNGQRKSVLSIQECGCTIS